MTNYNIQPYYDDFDAAKNFVKILINPGRAAQAREITQLQSILNNQTKELSKHFFKDGAKIFGADIDIDFNVIALTVSNFGNGATTVNNFLGQTISYDSNSAVVEKVDAANNKLFIKYRGGEFNVNNAVTVVDVDNTGIPAYSAEITAINNATFANITSGIIFIEGYYVVINEQSILVDGDSNTGSYQIGIEITDETITSAQDTTLLDPAIGFYNYNAPGADREKITLSLASYKTDNLPSAGTFHPKLFVENGELVKDEATTEYSDILKLLAQRTSETNGDYTVDPFLIKIEEDDTDDTRFNIILDPGIAYVKGFRQETISETKLSAKKARAFLTESESIWVDHSPYIKLDRDSISNIPAVSTIETIEFHQTPASDFLNWDNTTLIGTAKVIAIMYVDNEYRLYITDYDNVIGYIASSKGVKGVTSGFTASTILEDSDRFNSKHTVVYNTTSTKTNIYKFEQRAIKSHDDSQFIQQLQKQTTASVTSNKAVISTASGEEIDLSKNVIVLNSLTDKVLKHNIDYTTNNSTTSSLIIDFNIAVSSVKVHFFVEISGGSRKSKTLSTYTETVTSDGDGLLELNFEDVVSVLSITEDPSGTQTNISVDSIIFDNGQRDFYYDKGKISGLTPSTEYSVQYEYYIHGGSGNYFDINSYTNSGIKPEDIYDYTSSVGEVFNLGNTLDFRTKLSASSEYAIAPRSYLFSVYEYYLNRTDLLELDKDGNFNLIEGISSLDNNPPEGNSNAMSLYTIDVLAYTYSVNDVSPNFIENKNYTMRDIGALDNRIDKLEYYSSLNLLEKEATELQITDEIGNNKFKNGILVDSFIGGNVADVTNPEFMCAFDSERGQLRSMFSMENIKLDLDTRSSKHNNLVTNADGTKSDPINNIRIHENITTLEYTEKLWVNQDLASDYINVNPYNVFAWDGDLKLTPDSDFWIDTVRAPDLVTNIDGLYDNLIQQTIKAYGTKWGSWRTYWTGSSSITENIAGHNRNRSLINQDKLIRRSGIRGNTIRTTTTVSKQIRRGSRLVAIPNRIRKVVGDRVIDVSVIPYMRNRDIQFKAENLKPNTDLNIYFNDVLVNDAITPKSATYNPIDANYSVRTDGSGVAQGTFTIPTNTFRTGERPFTMIDDKQHPTTSAETTFIAAGHIQKKQRSVLSISKPRLVTVGVTQRAMTSSIRREFVRWYDPVAESFIVNQEGGAFLTSIDVYFKSKDKSLPVSLKIVETVNGYPSQTELPFSQVTVYPDDVNLSDDASAKTTFKFSDPVYVQSGSEYAFIVYSNSDAYNIFYGEIGKYDITKLPDKVRIQSQPYTGVFFKSQNGSTWTADQTKDLKFKINRANFVTKTSDLKTGDVWLLDDLSDLNGQNHDQHVDVYATTAQFEVDNLSFDLTELAYAYKFSNDPLFVETTNGAEITFDKQKRVTNDIANSGANVQHCETNIYMSTENPWVSPVISNHRSSVIMVNNATFGWNKNPYENINLPLLPQPDTDEKNYYNAGSYVTKTTSLANSADDIKAIIDVKKTGLSDIDMFYSTGKYISKYIEIYPNTIATVSDKFVGKTLYLYTQKDDSTLINETAMLCSGVNTDTAINRIYITGVTDPSKFKYQTDWPGNIKRMFVTYENMISTTLIADWDNTSDYGLTPQSYVYHNNVIWKAIEKSGPNNGGPVEPDEYGSTWLAIDHNEVCNPGIAGEEIKTEDEKNWKEMVIETQDRDEGKAKSDFVEYTFVPKNSIVETFSNFSIKIQLKSKTPTGTPVCSGLRVIATY